MLLSGEQISPPYMQDTTTTRYLWIIRHAHTQNALPGTLDHDRELSVKGRNQTQRMHDWLSGHIHQNDSVNVLCSSATRTQQTLKHCLPEHYTAASINRTVYAASLNTLLEQLQIALYEDARHTVLVGHNPGASQLVSYLANHDYTATHLKTGTIAGFSGDGELQRNNWLLRQLFHPNKHITTSS